MNKQDYDNLYWISTALDLPPFAQSNDESLWLNFQQLCTPQNILFLYEEIGRFSDINDKLHSQIREETK